MVDGMNWEYVKHKDLSKDDIIKISYLKEQHWPHGIESQILWMRNNIKANDIHLMGFLNSRTDSTLNAYMTLTNLQVSIDSIVICAIGVGCVCVEKSVMLSGMGKKLMFEANSFIIQEKKQGVLLCKDNLQGFYNKCGWHKLNYHTATVASQLYDKCIMALNIIDNCKEIDIDRNF